MKKKWIMRCGGLALLLALLFVPRIASLYVQTVIDKLLINIILVLGLNFITGLTGQMNLGTAGIFALGAYAYGILTVDMGVLPWLALGVVVVLGILIGRTLGYPSLRLQGFYLSLTTIGFSEIVRLFITNLSELTGGVNGLNGIRKVGLWFYQFVNYFDYYYVLLFFCVAATLIAHRLVHSKWGRAFKSIRDNDAASEALGIKISTLKIQAFTLTSLYACIAGALYAGMTGYINPMSFTIPEAQNYLAMLMIGGIGSVPGNVLGAILVTTLPEFLRSLGNYYWLVFCVVCLVMAVLVPHGLYPLIRSGVLSLYKRLTRKGGAGQHAGH